MNIPILRGAARVLLLALLAWPATALWAGENPAVPATTPTADFTLDDVNGTAYHKKTGLTWKRCAEGQTWSSGTCTGTAGRYNWSQALQRGPSLGTFAGFSDWRLPNHKELRSIVERRNWNPAINATVFPNNTPSRVFWSSTPFAPDPRGAWCVYVDSGRHHPDDKGNFDAVRMVRGGQYALLSVDKAGGGGGAVTSSLSGIDCGRYCTGSFANEMYTAGQVKLTATPDPESKFSGWSGACTGTAPTCTVLNPAGNVTALFTPISTFTLRVTKTGNGSGAVTSTPAGINCGSDCSEGYPTNTLVKLTAAPLNAGSAFVGWSGACAGTATPCTVKMDAAKTATATFKRVAALTVAKAGSGAGRISGPNINCGLDCTETYDLNTVVTLTAAASAGSTLIGWFNCPASPAPNQCQVTMSAARTVTARFDTTTAGKTALTLYKAGVGLGTVTSNPAGIACDPTCPTSVFNFSTGATVVLNVVEMTGSSFTGWSGCTVNPDNRRQCTVVLNTGKVVSATFIRPVLTVRKVGSGLIATPSGASTGIFCGTDCTEPYNLNTQVMLIAIPATGFRFTGWSGCTADSGFPQMCTVLMNQSKTATANFVR